VTLARKSCRKQHSVTLGTIFANRKLAICEILAAIVISITGAKGYSPLQMFRDLSVDYKTAFVMLRKISEAISSDRNEDALSGNVEIEGAYFDGYVKPANESKDCKNLRKANQSGKCRSVIVAREAIGRIITHVAQHEAPLPSWLPT